MGKNSPVWFVSDDAVAKYETIAAQVAASEYMTRIRETIAEAEAAFGDSKVPFVVRRILEVEQRAEGRARRAEAAQVVPPLRPAPSAAPASDELAAVREEMASLKSLMAAFVQASMNDAAKADARAVRAEAHKRASGK